MGLLLLITERAPGSLAIPLRYAQASATLARTSGQPRHRKCTTGKLSILLCLAGTVPQVFAAKPVTVAKLEQELAYAHGQPDTKVAEQLFDLALTERVSAARLARWEGELPGPKSRQALVELADASAFVSLPSEEIPATPAPDRAAQDSLLALTKNYAVDTIPKLPNFFATRDTTFFSDEPEKINTLTLVDAQYRKLHLVGVSSVKVYFRAGKEVVVTNTNKQVSFSGKALTTQGVFGEAMELVLSDILRNSLVWSHWEGGADALLAVFRYAVPLERSHYAVAIPDAPGRSQPSVAYHGEIAIDPANGTILRLTAVAELSGTSSIANGDVMVEYGPVEIAGASYICPVKSVSFTVARTVNTKANYQNKFGPASTKAGPLLTKVNDVQFKQYHRFRAETRILTGDDAEPVSTPPASGSVPNSTPKP
jgi:hypothetical protein